MPDTDPGSLSRLHDIVIPPPVPWWPPAPGWYVVGGIVLVLLGVGVWSAVSRWRRNRYRREALREFGRITASAQNLPAVALLLKRVALAAYPREQVASLTGSAWLAFLDSTGGNGAFTSGSGRFLESTTFEQAPRPPSEAELAELFTAIRHWMGHHRC